MSTPSKVVRYLDKECKRLRNPKRAADMGRYFKHVHPFYGIESAKLRHLIKQVQETHRQEWTASKLLETAEQLFADCHGEKKILGVYLLGVPFNRKIIQEESTVIQTIGGYIDNYVNDWATCDGLSSQVVRHLITSKPEYIPQVKQWCTSPNDWKQRASCVSFLCFASRGEHNAMLFEIATQVIRNEHRFPQLGAGWLLRELSVADENAVIDFIKENYNLFSREGLRYAIEKMDTGLRKELLSYGKDSR
jgi:3-methyladenine DNA glycosylase AlkD